MTELKIDDGNKEKSGRFLFCTFLLNCKMRRIHAERDCLGRHKNIHVLKAKTEKVLGFKVPGNTLQIFLECNWNDSLLYVSKRRFVSCLWENCVWRMRWKYNSLAWRWKEEVEAAKSLILHQNNLLKLTTVCACTLVFKSKQDLKYSVKKKKGQRICVKRKGGKIHSDTFQGQDNSFSCLTRQCRTSWVAYSMFNFLFGDKMLQNKIRKEELKSQDPFNVSPPVFSWLLPVKSYGSLACNAIIPSLSPWYARRINCLLLNNKTRKTSICFTRQSWQYHTSCEYLMQDRGTFNVWMLCNRDKFDKEGSSSHRKCFQCWFFVRLCVISSVCRERSLYLKKDELFISLRAILVDKGSHGRLRTTCKWKKKKMQNVKLIFHCFMVSAVDVMTRCLFHADSVVYLGCLMYRFM